MTLLTPIESRSAIAEPIGHAPRLQHPSVRRSSGNASRPALLAHEGFIEPPRGVERLEPAISVMLQPAPRPYAFWRHPLRFLRARWHLLRGGPLSVRWGLDRGMPAHRYYVRLFLREFQSDIRGACLEFDSPEYLNCFGDHTVTRADVLHINDTNPRANVVADLTRPNDIPDNSYDCIISTHVLQMIEDAPAAIEGMYRILKPGGVLLSAEPKLGMTDENEHDLWRFTRLGLHKLLARTFGAENVHARAYGNSLIAAGEMRGLIADEYTWRELHTHDARLAVEVCARAVKSSVTSREPSRCHDSPAAQKANAF